MLAIDESENIYIFPVCYGFRLIKESGSVSSRPAAFESSGLPVRQSCKICLIHYLIRLCSIRLWLLDTQRRGGTYHTVDLEIEPGLGPTITCVSTYS